MPATGVFGGEWFTLNCNIVTSPGNGRGDPVSVSLNSTIHLSDPARTILPISYAITGTIANQDTGELSASWTKSPGAMIPTTRLKLYESTWTYYEIGGKHLRTRLEIWHEVSFAYSASTYAASLSGSVRIYAKAFFQEGTFNATLSAAGLELIYDWESDPSVPGEPIETDMFIQSGITLSVASSYEFP